MKMLVAAVAVLAFGVAAPVAAGEREDARSAYERGDYATALRLTLPLAEHGDAEAQFNIGSMYFRGRGVPQDIAQAVKWYVQAAERGYSPAQATLGTMHYLGTGVPPDYAEAVKWYRRAADQGSAEAQYGLGIMYAYGRGVRQDFVQASKWLHIAIASQETYEAWGQAREQAQELLEIVATELTPAQIAEAQKLAREWKPKQ